MPEVTEHIYTIPLNTRKYPRTIRAKKAILLIKEFVARNVKCDFNKVWIDREVNEKIWVHGIQKPPKKLKVNVTKFDEYAEVKLIK